MDIDPRSLWYDGEFNNSFGGFFPKGVIERDELGLYIHDNVRRDMLLLLCKSIADRKVNGSIAELGVFKGQSARLFHHYFPDRKLYLLDTFSGFPKKDVDKEKSVTGLSTTEDHFSNTGIDLVRKIIKPSTDNIHFIKGYFPDSVTNELKNDRFALVHLDADLYQPTISGLQFFYPKLNPGGFIIVHDYNAWPGARTAVDEYCQEQKLLPIPMPDKSGSCVLIKP